MSLCNGKESLYIPINHISSVYKTPLKNQIPGKILRDYINNLNETRKFRWVYHNYKFDAGVFRTFLGKDMPAPYWDTMIAAYMFNQDEEHSLKFQYNKYIAEEDEGVNRFDTLFKGVTFDYIPLDIATIYAGKDGLMTYKLYEYQKAKFERKEFEGIKFVYENIEVPIMPILTDMNRYGVNMNLKMLKQLEEKYEAKLEETKKRVYAEIKPYEAKIEEFRIKNYNKKLDNPISISSPAQLSILFYDIIGYKQKDGKGTGVKELERINTPLTNALLDYRKLEKIIDAFLVALPKQIEPYDGKIHTTLNQYGAATGRFSSNGPNLQQIPSRGEAKEIRRLFGASPGKIMMSSDFSQFNNGHYISNNI